MKSTAKRILELLDDPDGLEAFYRQDPDSFRAAFDSVHQQVGASPVARFWKARLSFTKPATGIDRVRLWHAIVVGLCAAALVRVPAVWLGPEWYYPRFAPMLVALSVTAYFWLRSPKRAPLIGGLILSAIVVGHAVMLPPPVGSGTNIHYTDSVVMALIHLPILFWGFLGYVFTGTSWRDPEARMRFVRYNGELLILGSLVGLGGMVFSGITMALFGLVAEGSQQWYAENIGVPGVAGVPVAATFLYECVFNKRTGIASVLARVFAPLFLIMTVVYLVFAFLGGQNPFVDRSFLIVVNGLLIVVLGMTVFSIAERGGGSEIGWIDYINVALLAVTLVINLIALTAIAVRLTSDGLTPNRVFVLGANVVIMTHLAWMCRAYIGLARGKSGIGKVRATVTNYLPVYLAWAALAFFVLTLVFRFS